MPQFNAGTPVTVSQPHDLAAAGEQYQILEVRQGVNAFSLQTADGNPLKWFLEDELAAAGEQQQPQQPPAQQSITDEQLAAAMSAKFGVSPDTLRQMQAGFATTGKKNRESRIKDIRLALEGKLALDGVQQVQGYRHAPTVVAAVVKALTEKPAALKMSVDFEGTSEFDQAILDIVNAIPQEGRVLVAETFSNVTRQDGEEVVVGNGHVSKEAVEEYSNYYQK